ncbi:MAG TPA: DHA2 family efflux MFS transporter permease subunit [Chloroflexota bacterium]|nr:DHA2 family efflux MFS transporter permease subunit [Chloroflexota bacterium]
MQSAPPETQLSTPRIVTNAWIILLVLTLGFFMILLDTTIVNVAIPSIIDGLHAGLDQILWVLNAYILVYAVLLITAGRLGDMYGPRRMFITGLVIFTLASAACGVAGSPNQLILFRIIQAIGGALLTPQSLSIITSIFPPERRGAAFGVWGAVAGVAAVAGPTLGGFLTTTYSWRAIFYVNVPIGIVAVLLAYLVMPELTNHRRHRLDIPGMVLASAGLFLLVFGLIEGQRYNWGPVLTWGAHSLGPLVVSPVSIATILLASVILLAIFIVDESHAEEPLLPLSLFRDRNFSLANVVSALVAFGMLGLFLPFTIFLQSVLGLDAEHAGFVMVPMSLTSMVLAPISGRLTDKVNGKYLLAAGLVFFSVGMLLVIALASLTSTGTTFTPALIVAGIGMGFTFAPMVTMAMRNIPPARAGAASGFINTIRQVGGAFGSAVVGAILQHQLATDLHAQALRYSAGLPASFRARFVAGFSHASSTGFQVGRGQTGTKLPPGLPAQVVRHVELLARQVFNHAFLDAMKPALVVPICLMMLGAIAALFMEGQRRAAAEERARGEEAGGIAAAGQ